MKKIILFLTFCSLNQISYCANAKEATETKKNNTNENYKEGYEALLRWIKEHDNDLKPEVVNYFLTIMAYYICGDFFELYEHGDYTNDYDPATKLIIKNLQTSFKALEKIYCGWHKIPFSTLSEEECGKLLDYLQSFNVIRPQMYADFYEWARQNDRLKEKDENNI